MPLQHAPHTSQVNTASLLPQEDRDPEDRTASFVAAVKASGMSAPLAIALQVFKPLAWMGGQMVWILQPLLEGTGVRPGRGTMAWLATFLEREENLTRMADSLAEGAPSPKEADGPQ